METLDRIILERPFIYPHYEVCEERMKNSLKAIDDLSDCTLGKHLGHFYRRFDQLKTQISALLSFGADEAEGNFQLEDSISLLVKFESECKKVLLARIDSLILFDALCKAQSSQQKKTEKTIVSPLEVSFDRCSTFSRSVQQMILNSKVRYNQAIFKVEYRPNKPGKPTEFSCTNQQVSISLFSRHIAFLEIVFPKKKAFRKQRNDVWSYQLMFPIIPLSKISLFSVPETNRCKFLF